MDDDAPIWAARADGSGDVSAVRKPTRRGRTGGKGRSGKTDGTTVREGSATLVESHSRAASPHLVDVAPHEDEPADLAAFVRRSAPRDVDVRLFVEDGEQALGTAAALAEILWCDVYLPPPDARIVFEPESGFDGGEAWEAVVIDRVTSRPVDWQVVRHPDMPETVPTWFVSQRGRLRVRTGLVSLPLPNGLALATKATVRDVAYLAARLRDTTARLSTVAVTVDQGRFQISPFDGTGSRLGGVEFATLVTASFDLIHPDVQLALSWPRDEEDCRVLDAELMRLADGLNRTVWVPAPAGSAIALPGCGDFAAVDEVGSPSRWAVYPSRLDTDWQPRFRTDPDGRLTPIGDLSLVGYPGVPLVSVPDAQLERLRERYESILPLGDGLFAVDLAVLDDGRLGVCRRDGMRTAVGPRLLGRLLSKAGWAGEDLVLLAEPPAELWPGTVAHAEHLVDALKVDVWLPEPGAGLVVRPSGRLVAEGPGGADCWYAVSCRRGDEAPALPEALADRPEPPMPPEVIAPPEPAEENATTPAEENAATPAAENAASAQAAENAAALTEENTAEENTAEGDAATGTAEVVRAEPAPAAKATVDKTALEPSAVIAATVATRPSQPHAVPWLPATAAVNTRPIDLYLWTPAPHEQAEQWGLSTADLFLLAGQDPLRIADRRRSGCLLRLAGPPYAAVDLLEYARHMPATVEQRLRETGSTHLLPLAWLARFRVTARYDIDARGGISPLSAEPTEWADRPELDAPAGPAAELAVCFEGAEHGVRGLPNEVVTWPDRRLRQVATTYLTLPEGGAPGQALDRLDYLPLSRRRPKVGEGQLLWQITIGRRSAIDVPATLGKLAGLPVVGRLHDFTGLDLLLPERMFGQAIVTKVWHGGRRRRSASDRAGRTVADALAPDAHTSEALASDALAPDALAPDALASDALAADR